MSDEPATRKRKLIEALKSLGIVGVSATSALYDARPVSADTLGDSRGLGALGFDPPVFINSFLNDGLFNIFAQHRSHSSHSSHASHSSHFSSSGGGGGTYSPPPPSPPAQVQPPPKAPETLVPRKPTTDELALIVTRVQAALYARGYDPGAIDGILGQSTRDALTRFQKEKGLPADGQLNTATLNALAVKLTP